MIDFNDKILISCSKLFVYVNTIKCVQLDCLTYLNVRYSLSTTDSLIYFIKT